MQRPLDIDEYRPSGQGSCLVKIKCIWLSAWLATSCLIVVVSSGVSQESKAPRGIESEQSLPSRYSYVVEDALRYCRPRKGCWVDLGAGQGEVALALIEATGNPVVMLDPDREAMTKGLATAREKHLGRPSVRRDWYGGSPAFSRQYDRFRGQSRLDLLLERPRPGSQGSYRVLRPGGKAYIGGGAGSGYPAAAVDKLIQQRKAQLQGEEAEKWQRFVELRRPEQMTKWATDAGLPHFDRPGQRCRLGRGSARGSRSLAAVREDGSEHRTLNIQRPTSHGSGRTSNIQPPASNVE